MSVLWLVGAAGTETMDADDEGKTETGCVRCMSLVPVCSMAAAWPICHTGVMNELRAEWRMREMHLIRVPPIDEAFH